MVKHRIKGHAAEQVITWWLEELEEGIALRACDGVKSGFVLCIYPTGKISRYNCHHLDGLVTDEKGRIEFE